ncbi:MAG TPA: YCF48-related protein [Ignavibacteria bacterium]|nr:YCF48-related protein [Ignavibacteria bacterium]
MPKILLTIALIFGINSVLFSQSGWIWQNPLPQGNYMSNLQFVNSTTAYAMCYNSVMKTTNSGSNWSIYYTMYEQNNASMHFVNINTGFIVCDTGIVIKTTNGGFNWNVIYDFEQKRFHKIYFVDINTGYVLRYNKLYNYEGTSLSRTTNGGSQWNQILSDSTYTIEGLSFPGDQNGYLAGYGSTPHPNTFYAKFLRSTDNGLYWDSISNPLYSRFYGCKFINANTGIAYGDRVFSSNKSAYTTTNGGVNWIPSDLSMRVYYVEQISNNTFLASADFPALYKSTNNGLNWYLFNSSFPNLSFDFINESYGLAVGGTGDIRITTNSGLNWNSQIINNNSYWLWGVDFVNENTGYAVDDNHLLKTTNGGNNWNVVFTHSLYHLDFVDANTGYCGGTDSLFKTTNGGLTFSQVQYTNTPRVLNEIQFLNANTGFIMGKYEETWKTINGGENWITISSYGSGYHECLFFYNEFLGFIGRDDNNLGVGVSRTTNGGLNWDFHEIPSLYNIILDIYFIDDHTGFFSTTNQIYKTTNSGINWQSVYDYNNNYYSIEIYAIQFINNNVAYAAITNGKILKSTDSGNTWKMHNTITNSGFYDLYFTDVNTGYIVGSGGKIIKTTNGGGSPIGIEPISSIIPNNFMLYQNYPNPFNPVTAIRFSIPPGANGRNEITTLKIYDILGKEISVPVNELLAPGEYEITWNAGDFPSGVYFCRLSSGNLNITRKLIFLK